MRKIELIEGIRGHWYRVEGVRDPVPSVSTVIGDVLAKPALVPWATRMALARVERELQNHKGKKSITDKWIKKIIDASRKEPLKVAEAAADIGTRAHYAIHCEIMGYKCEDTSPQVKRAVESFFVWEKQSGLKITLSEKMVFSESTLTAGTLDAFARKKNKPVLIDFKTSKAIYNDMAFQVGGYSLGWEDTYGESVDEGWIIRFPKDPDDPLPFEAKQVVMSNAKQGFRLCKQLFDIKRQALFLEN